MCNLRQTLMLAPLVAVIAGCSSLEPVFIPQGTVVDTPATIKVSIPKDIALSASEPKEVRLPVSKVGTLDVHDSELLVLLQLDPIVQVVRAHARRIEFSSRQGRKTLDVDGFLVDSAGIADFSVDCKRRTDATDCDGATLSRRDDVLEMILLQPIDLGGTTLMSTTHVVISE